MVECIVGDIDLLISIDFVLWCLYTVSMFSFWYSF